MDTHTILCLAASLAAFAPPWLAARLGEAWQAMSEVPPAELARRRVEALELIRRYAP